MYTLVLVSKSWNGKRKLVVKMRNEDKEVLVKEKARLEEFSSRNAWSCNSPDYRVLGPRQLQMLQEDVKAEQQARRAKGAKKAAETRKQKGATAFVLCPTCNAKSKKLFSEMGGLETRVCQWGHRFEYDRWIADRSFWNPGAAIPNIYKKL